MSPMFSLHSGPTLPLSVPDINAFFSHFGVIMFFWKDPPQTEGRRNAHLLIKTSPARLPDAARRTTPGKTNEWAMEWARGRHEACGALWDDAGEWGRVSPGSFEGMLVGGPVTRLVC